MCHTSDNTFTQMVGVGSPIHVRAFSDRLESSGFSSIPKPAMIGESTGVIRFGDRHDGGLLF